MKIHQREDSTVASLYDKNTDVISDRASRSAAIIDPELDFDELAGATSTRNADLLLEYVERERLDVVWVLDTHPHADHFSAAPYLSGRLGAPTAIGSKVVEV
jgi:glyoxylase-like metal-dependent hydrolase (beta-lactamase superfamily II)